MGRLLGLCGKPSLQAEDEGRHDEDGDPEIEEVLRPLPIRRTPFLAFRASFRAALSLR